MVTHAIDEVDAAVPVSNVETMTQRLTDSGGTMRFSSFLASMFAGAALLLGMVGIYSVIAYVVEERRREIGIRLALGASPSRLVRDVLRQAFVLTSSGIALGTVTAWILSRTVAHSRRRGTATISGFRFRVGSLSPPLSARHSPSLSCARGRERPRISHDARESGGCTDVELTCKHNRNGERERWRAGGSSCSARLTPARAFLNRTSGRPSLSSPFWTAPALLVRRAIGRSWCGVSDRTRRPPSDVVDVADSRFRTQSGGARLTRKVAAAHERRPWAAHIDQHSGSDHPGEMLAGVPGLVFASASVSDTYAALFRDNVSTTLRRQQQAPALAFFTHRVSCP